MRLMLSWILAAVTFLSGLAVALSGFGAAFVSWEERPPVLAYDTGDPQSVERALTRAHTELRESLVEHYTQPLLLVSAMLVVATTVLAIVFVRGWQARRPRAKADKKAAAGAATK